MFTFYINDLADLQLSESVVQIGCICRRFNTVQTNADYNN